MWESEDVLYDPDIDIFETTSARKTRYVTTPNE